MAGVPEHSPLSSRPKSHQQRGLDFPFPPLNGFPPFMDSLADFAENSPQQGGLGSAMVREWDSSSGSSFFFAASILF